MDNLIYFFHCLGGLSAAICTALWFTIWAMCMKRHNSISSRMADIEIKQMRDQIEINGEIRKLAMILHTQQRRMDNLECQMTGKPVMDVPVNRELLDIMTKINDY